MVEARGHGACGVIDVDATAGTGILFERYDTRYFVELNLSEAMAPRHGTNKVDVKHTALRVES